MSAQAFCARRYKSLGLSVTLVCCGLVADSSSADCDIACRATAKPLEVARNYYQETKDSQRNRAKADYWTARKQSEAEQDQREAASERHQQILDGLEEKLDRARGRSRSAPARKARTNANCMYGTGGVLIHAKRGAKCTAGINGWTHSPGTGPPLELDRRGGRVRPVSVPGAGCFRGNCSGGHGTFIWSDGSRYVGGFKNGRQHGRGAIVYSNGATYVGDWRHGKRSGEGTAMYPDGRTRTGTWRYDKFMSYAGGGSRATAEIPWPDLSLPPPRAIGGGKYDAAVIVGIENYAHVAAIPGAERNAKDWYNYLVTTRGIPIDRVALLIDADATREEMRFAVQEAANQVGKRGSLWFVFVGHGAPSPNGTDGLLVGFDVQQKARSLNTRSLARADLIRTLEKSKAKRINVLLDACFSGRTSEGKQLVAGLQPLIITSDHPTSDSRTTLMTAARSDQFAGPLPGTSRPAFSYLVLGGLRGWADRNGDRRIDAEELHRYVSSSMNALIRGRRQNPTLVSQKSAELVKSARETGPDIAAFVMRFASPASPTR